MASAILGNIKEEVTCPICLDLLTEPMSIDCGHSFCQTCITSNYESMTSQKGESSCPVCRTSYQFENLRPNRHVANIVENLKGVKLSPEEEQKVSHCARHGEKLLLFCKQDEQVICWLCERTKEHRGHTTFLLEEVAHEYQEMLQDILGNLVKTKEESEKFNADIQNERTFWKNKIQCEIENVQAEFEKLRGILDSEEELEIQKLKKEEEDILESLTESENELTQQSQLLRELVSALEYRLEASTVEMLQNLHDVMIRCRNFKLKKPEMFPKEQRRIFRAPDLRRMLQASQELINVQRYWVHVTLTPSKNPSFVISKDQRQLNYMHCFTFGRENYYEGVLGSPVMTSGKHYWEVDVSKKRAWYLGLNDGRCWRSSFIHGVGERNNYQPKCGYWVIGLQNCEFYAFGENAALEPLRLTLSVTVPPHRIGIFLDFEAGELSFYNITNHGSLIYRFSKCSFSRHVFPYFNPGTCLEVMTLCWPSF